MKEYGKMDTVIDLYVRVRLELFGNEKELLTLVIVPDASANLSGGLLGISTPLAQRILGATAGQTLDYLQGDLKAVHILSVEPAPEVDPLAAAQHRREEAARMKEEVAARNAAAFAASFSGKWGDYDPDGVARWQDNQDNEDDRKNSENT